MYEPWLGYAVDEENATVGGSKLREAITHMIKLITRISDYAGLVSRECHLARVWQLLPGSIGFIF
jgi:hypothetical protein